MTVEEYIESKSKRACADVALIEQAGKLYKPLHGWNWDVVKYIGEAGTFPIYWNPIREWGHAMALATYLKISIIHHDGMILCETERLLIGERPAEGEDYDEAVRRCIVRTAAAMAKDQGL